MSCESWYATYCLLACERLYHYCINSSYCKSTGNYELLDSSGRNATTVYLRLTDDKQMSCVQVIAVDDAKLEWPRNFTVKIEEIGTNSLNMIYPNEITVVITDNDGEFQKSFLPNIFFCVDSVAMNMIAILTVTDYLHIFVLEMISKSQYTIRFGLMLVDIVLRY